MDTPYLDELLRRLRTIDPDAALVGPGRLSWHDRETNKIVTLIAEEADLVAAVLTGGEEVRDALWPTSTIEEAGFNILLAHLDEILATRVVAAPLRITAGGLVWPRERPSRW